MDALLKEPERNRASPGRGRGNRMVQTAPGPGNESIDGCFLKFRGTISHPKMVIF